MAKRRNKLYRQRHAYESGDTSRDIVVRYVRGYIIANKRPPTQREIAHGCYLTQSAVRYVLERLEAHGRIEYARGTTRGIKLTEAA